MSGRKRIYESKSSMTHIWDVPPSENEHTTNVKLQASASCESELVGVEQNGWIRAYVLPITPATTI
jgi:hypothetical protein